MCIGRNVAAYLNICIECSIFLSVHVFNCIGQEVFSWLGRPIKAWVEGAGTISYFVQIFPQHLHRTQYVGMNLIVNLSKFRQHCWFVTSVL
jgi:hypothetical protein